MSLRILEAIFRKDGVEKVISLADMTDGDYQNIYNGHLFCPNSNCNARIVYASGSKRTYFRTWQAKVVDGKVVNEHIEDCPYHVEHELGERAIRRRDSDLLYRLSNEHIKRVLDNAYDREHYPDKFKKKSKPVGDITKRASSKSRIDYTLQPSGKAGLGIDGAIVTSEKEPPVHRKLIDDVTDMDYLNTECVIGTVKDMVLNETYPYITLMTKDHRKARILFSEAFAVNYPAIFNNLKVYKQYINLVKANGEVPFICCIGKITKDDYGISVIIEDYRTLAIERKRYYQIVNEMVS